MAFTKRESAGDLLTERQLVFWRRCDSCNRRIFGRRRLRRGVVWSTELGSLVGTLAKRFYTQNADRVHHHGV